MTDQRAPERLLVTGGCGFIGSAFVRDAVARGCVVVNVDALTYAANPGNVASVADSDTYHFAHLDINDAEATGALLDQHDIDTIVHFAAESHVDRSILSPLPFVHTNVVGTVQLLEAVRKRPAVHFHHVSTDEVYGSLGKTGAFHETTAYDPRSPYAASKAASDHFVRAYAHTFDLSATLSNCSNNYGPYQFPEKLIPLMLLNMLEGKELPVYGDGSNVRDWLYVDDHIEALWAVIERGVRGRTYNVGGGAERTNIDLLHALIAEVSDQAGLDGDAVRSTIRFVTDRPGHDQRYAIDASRIDAELGWRPRHSLAEGLQKTVAWYIDNGDWVESVTSGAYRDWVDQNYGERL